MTTLNRDLSKPTCRVCLQSNQNGKMSSIFDLDADFCNLRIYEKIEHCAGIEVLRHEKMPTLICGDCYGFLKVSYKFRIICRNTNEYLKEFVSTDSAISKIENSFEHNPLLISLDTINEEIECSKYETKLIDKNIKNEHILSYSPTNMKVELDGNNCDDNEVWLDYDYQYDDISCSDNIEVSIETLRRVKEESYQSKTEINFKQTNPKKKKVSGSASKTLEISSDGAAIIREKKTRIKREKKEKQPHICDVCGNIYQRRYALELHIRRHRDEKPYECEICGYAFHSNFELIRHMRKHTGSRPYKCSFCSRAFGDQSSLKKHERIHRNERPFKCDTCGKSFTYSNVLKHHKLTHTGEKPYGCELCGKCFTRPHHLRAHLETLQHQSDPRSKILLQNIKKNNEDEILKVKNSTITNTS